MVVLVLVALIGGCLVLDLCHGRCFAHGRQMVSACSACALRASQRGVVQQMMSGLGKLGQPLALAAGTADHLLLPAWGLACLVRLQYHVQSASWVVQPYAPRGEGHQTMCVCVPHMAGSQLCLMHSVVCKRLPPAWQQPLTQLPVRLPSI